MSAIVDVMGLSTGGIGGGGILVPLYILVLGMDAKHAIPLSNFTILVSRMHCDSIIVVIISGDSIFGC